MTNNHKNKNNNNKTKKITGGKVIASGGFGCILKPNIQCKKANETTETKQGVTKLLKKKYARKEYNEIVKFKPFLKKIPNYTDYFLIEGFSLCEPASLTKEDLGQFNEKCTALKKMKITEDNVNDSLNKLLAIQMPYGGVDVGEYIEQNVSKEKEQNLILLNNQLIVLLKKGILPMNEHRIYHCDLKSANILVLLEKDEMKTRIIDWGLSTMYHPGKPIPKNLLNRPFQYNVPFSNVLFTSMFTKSFNKFLNKNPDINYYNIRTFVINYVLEWVEKRGPGHLKTIHSIFKELFEGDLNVSDEIYKNELIQFDFTFYFIFEYITQVLLKFTNKERKGFDSLKYFNEVYLKNVDIWGFVLSYIPIMEYLSNNYKELSESQEKIVLKIKELILHLLKYSDTPMDMDSLEKKLISLNEVLPFLNKGKQGSYKIEDDTKKNTASETKPKPSGITKRISKLTEETEKEKILSAGSISHDTPKTKRNKKIKYHKMMVKTLKHIKHRHSKNEWM